MGRIYLLKNDCVKKTKTVMYCIHIYAILLDVVGIGKGKLHYLYFYKLSWRT